MVRLYCVIKGFMFMAGENAKDLIGVATCAIFSFVRVAWVAMTAFPAAEDVLFQVLLQRAPTTSGPVIMLEEQHAPYVVVVIHIRFQEIPQPIKFIIVYCSGAFPIISAGPQAELYEVIMPPAPDVSAFAVIAYYSIS